MSKMLEDLAEVVRLLDVLREDMRKSNYAPLSDVELGMANFIQTHHATITDMAKRLEAADALLREAVEWNWLDDWVSDMHELDGRIQAHLQESGE